MARQVPARFIEKLEDVDHEVRQARTGPPCDFDVTTEVASGVRLVASQLRGQAVVFSLWTLPRDIAEICGDGAYPSTSGLLAIDRNQVAELSGHGAVVDLAGLVRSESVPGLYYTLFDHLDEDHLRVALGRVLAPPVSGSRRAAG